MNTLLPKAYSLVISYLVLRQAIGYLGIALPFVLAIGGMLVDGQGLQRSMSSYYHTPMRDIFVGTLCAIGVFMLSYRGYERKDDIAGNLACLFAVGVALFPVAPPCHPTALERLIEIVHLIFAGAFFLTMAYFSLALFTKTDSTKPPTRRKLQRNSVYKICGYTILLALGLIAIGAMLPDTLTTSIEKFQPVFWLQSISVLAFGFSWVTKGEAILADEA